MKRTSVFPVVLSFKVAFPGMLGGALILGPSFVTGCVASTQESTTQCRTQEDCIARGPEFADTTCTADRVCRKVELLEKSCSTNQECVDRNGGASYICRKSDAKCVPLITPQCQRVFGDRETLLDDNTVYMGMVVPDNAAGNIAAVAAQWAQREIKGAGGLPPATPGGPRRPLAIVACTGEDVSVAYAQSQYDHLAKTLQVPAVLAPTISARAVQGVLSFHSNDTLVMSTNSTGVLNNLSNKDLFFRLGPNEDDLTKALPSFLSGFIEPQLVAEGMKAAGDPTRAVVIKYAGQTGDALAKAVTDNVTLNGARLADPANSENVQFFEVADYGNPVVFPNPDAKSSQAVQLIVQRQPHVVIFAAVPEAISPIWRGMQQLWPVGVPRPYNVSILTVVSTALPPVARQVNNEEARKKTFGLQGQAPDFSQSRRTEWDNGFRLAFPAETSVIPSFSRNTGLFYDAVYLFAYSVAAIGNAPLRGPELAKGMRKVAGSAGGQTIPWGPADYNKAMAILAGGNNISFVGVNGSYGFNEKGERPTTADVWCLAKPGPAASSIVSASSGFTYDLGTGQAAGAVANCNF